jgi:hypothetical protein
MSQFAAITCKERWEIKEDLPQDDDFDNAHEGPFTTFKRNLEIRTSGGLFE